MLKAWKISPTGVQLCNTHLESDTSIITGFCPELYTEIYTYISLSSKIYTLWSEIKRNHKKLVLFKMFAIFCMLFASWLKLIL